MSDGARLPNAPVDVRLVVSDMDGTLLDGHGRLPDDFWPMLDRLRERGVTFVPASGRQYATLAREFGGRTEATGGTGGLAFIAENGTYVVLDGEEVSSTPMAPASMPRIVRALRDLDPGRHDIGVVVCGKRSAYVERADDPFLDEARRYYAALEIVPDLLEVDDDILKVAIYDFDDAETGTAPALAPFRASHQVVVSGRHWIDIMEQGVHKGVAVRRLQDALDITPAQTAVFGDYLNDLDMLDAGDLSFAVANAHPDVRARARYDAPANTEHGVLTVLAQLV
jgi:Cof subfamily protein (haloacid dehalogenase superfamily)